MSDDKTRTCGQDRERINVNEDYEVRDWAAKFGVTEIVLHDTVARVGDRVEDVRRELEGR